MKFSANLGFLWADLPLPEAIRAAEAAGFDAVECHWPYAYASSEVANALTQTNLRMLGLNTARGDLNADEFGLSALEGRQADARAAIDQAMAYGADIGAAAVHVMAGRASGALATEVFESNLNYACDRAAAVGMTVLIEPINHGDVPGYFLQTTRQAVEIIEKLARTELRLMFDCYHVALTEGNVMEAFKACRSYIGHIQFARVPDRGAPIGGDVDYTRLLRDIAHEGWNRPFGAEYRVDGATESSLGWMQAFRSDE